MGEFEWPWQYSFPPFYTLQPNLATRKKQLEAWCELVLSFHRHNRLYLLDVTEAATKDLFYNQKINRKLSPEFIKTIIEELRKKGEAEWLNSKQQRCLILWRSIAEWASLIYAWASESGQLNSICTLFEITQGDYTSDQQFYGLEKELLLRALKHLEDQGKAQVMLMEGSEGVKFLAS